MIRKALIVRTRSMALSCRRALSEVKRNIESGVNREIVYNDAKANNIEFGICKYISRTFENTVYELDVLDDFFVKEKICTIVYIEVTIESIYNYYRPALFNEKCILSINKRIDVLDRFVKYLDEQEKEIED